jgi:hypothetical protein
MNRGFMFGVYAKEIYIRLTEEDGEFISTVTSSGFTTASRLVKPQDSIAFPAKFPLRNIEKARGVNS